MPYWVGERHEPPGILDPPHTPVGVVECGRVGLRQAGARGLRAGGARRLPSKPSSWRLRRPRGARRASRLAGGADVGSSSSPLHAAAVGSVHPALPRAGHQRPPGAAAVVPRLDAIARRSRMAPDHGRDDPLRSTRGRHRADPPARPVELTYTRPVADISGRFTESSMSPAPSIECIAAARSRSIPRNRGG